MRSRELEHKNLTTVEIDGSLLSVCLFLKSRCIRLLSCRAIHVRTIGNRAELASEVPAFKPVGHVTLKLLAFHAGIARLKYEVSK